VADISPDVDINNNGTLDLEDIEFHIKRWIFGAAVAFFMCALVVYAFLHETPAETLSGFTAVADAGLGHAEDVTIGILFEAADVNGDGKLSPEEFKQRLTESGSRYAKKRETEMKKVFGDALDVQLSLGDWKTYFLDKKKSHMKGGKTSGEADRLLSTELDSLKEHNAKRIAEENAANATAADSKDLTLEEETILGKIFDTMDMAGKDALSPEEFELSNAESAHVKRFAEIDVDKNGNVTKDEMIKFGRQMKKNIFMNFRKELDCWLELVNAAVVKANQARAHELDLQNAKLAEAREFARQQTVSKNGRIWNTPPEWFEGNRKHQWLMATPDRRKTLEQQHPNPNAP